MFTTTVTPRFGDVDGLRHINNTRLPEWFEQARNPLFRLFNPEMDLQRWNLIMAHIEVDFVGQLFLGADIEIRTYILGIGNSSFTVGHEAWQNGQIGARGKAVIVYYDFTGQQSRTIPDDIRASLSTHLVREDDPN